MPAEQCPDELSDNVVTKHRREVHIFSTDTATSAIHQRCTSCKDIQADFGWLNLERFPDTKEVANVYNDAFENVAKTCCLDTVRLRNEYKSFVSCYAELKKTVPV